MHHSHRLRRAVSRLRRRLARRPSSRVAFLGSVYVGNAPSLWIPGAGPVDLFDDAADHVIDPPASRVVHLDEPRRASRVHDAAQPAELRDVHFTPAEHAPACGLDLT